MNDAMLKSNGFDVLTDAQTSTMNRTDTNASHEVLRAHSTRERIEHYVILL